MLTGELEFEKGVVQGVNAYSFGQFRLDLSRGALLHSGKQQQLRPKAFDVLLCLVSHAGELVSREALLEAVWPNLVVTDDSLTQCLIEIRRVIGDHDRRIIRTIPRRGYRFEAEVKQHLPVESQTELPFESGSTASRLPSRWTMFGMLALAIAIAATWWYSVPDSRDTDDPFVDWTPPSSSIAVLSFADMSEAGDLGYLAEGVSEEILNSLAQSQELTVIARTSSFSFKNSNADIKTIARHLNVANVLEGSVRIAGDRARVTAQLVDGKTEAHVWSKTYEERVDDVFAMQDRIAQEVAKVLHVELTSRVRGDTKMHLPSPEAWEAYSLGRLFYSRRSGDDILLAQENFEKALEIDPVFADAWVSLAATYGLRAFERHLTPETRMSSDEALPLIRNALETALDIDPQNPEALWRLSRFAWSEGRTDDAIDLMTRSMQLGQNHAVVQSMMAGFAFKAGDTLLAVPFIRRAVALDPQSASHQNNLGAMLYHTGLLTEAAPVLSRAKSLSPDFSHEADLFSAWISIDRRELDHATQLANTLEPGGDKYLTLALLNDLKGDVESANTSFERLLTLPPEEGAIRCAAVYANRGETNSAFESLNLALETFIDQPQNLFLRIDLSNSLHSPLLTDLFDDPRWSAWRSAVKKQLQGDVFHQALLLLDSYLNDHPELYEQPKASEQ